MLGAILDGDHSAAASLYADSPISEENPLSALKDVVNTYVDGFRRSESYLVPLTTTD